MMKFITFVILLFFLSCGRKSGGGSYPIPPTPSPVPGNDYSFGNLDKFKQSVANNKWAQDTRFSSYNYYKFKYRSPTGNCQKKGSGIFYFYFCLDTGAGNPTWISEEKKGVVINPLIPLSKIKDIVARSVLWAPYTLINPAIPYAYFDGSQWTIILGKETLTFNPSYPLAANPLYYKNETTEYSMYFYEYSWIP